MKYMLNISIMVKTPIMIPKIKDRKVICFSSRKTRIDLFAREKRQDLDSHVSGVLFDF